MSLSKISLIILFWFTPSALFALEISTFPSVPIRNDIVLSPAKVELNLEPGVELIQYLDVTNRMGQDAAFSFDIEDFAPSGDSHGGVILDKTVDGLESSLKKYLSVDPPSFVLSHGQQAHIPVTIRLPKKIIPGGLYGVVLVSGIPLKNESGSTKIITRLGSMFFVKVNGSLNSSGVLKSVSFYNDKIEIVFENGGDIYLNPYGIINIYDYYSKKLVSKIDIDPWFVLPRSTRSRMVAVGNLVAGKYTAEISLNRGYSDILDKRDLNFEIGSIVGRRQYKILVSICVAVIILLLYKFCFYAKQRS